MWWLLLVGILAGCDRLLGLDKLAEDGGGSGSGSDGATWTAIAVGWYHTCGIARSRRST